MRVGSFVVTKYGTGQVTLVSDLTIVLTLEDGQRVWIRGDRMWSCEE